MKVLIDECSPRALKNHLARHGHECVTVQEAGWAGKKNGELIDLAEAGFDVLVTLDTNLRYQQNLASRRIAIVVLESSSNRLDHLRQFFPECVLAIAKIKPGQIVRVGPRQVKFQCKLRLPQNRSGANRIAERLCITTAPNTLMRI